MPYLVDDAGFGMEDSQLICAYLDSLDGKPRFHHPLHATDWAYRQFGASARSMCDGISVWVREMNRPEKERSPTVLSHEVARSHRMADHFAACVSDQPMQGPPGMAHLILAVALDTARKRGPDDLTSEHPGLAAWLQRFCDLPSMQATAIR